MPPAEPIMIKDRFTFVFLEKGEIDVIDGAFVLVDKNGIRIQIPVGGTTCLMLEPGTRITHAAVLLAATVGCLLLWVGEAGVRLYSAGKPNKGRADNIMRQAKLALNETTRIQVARKMYALRFDDQMPDTCTIEQMRGIEGARVKQLYKILAQRAGIKWCGRLYQYDNWEADNLQNRCLSVATSCLYGLCEAAILAAGYSPAFGFIHTGESRSFIYDIADLFKFTTVVPVAFKIAATNTSTPERDVRLGCRDAFRETRLLKLIIPTIDAVLDIGVKT